MPNLINALEQVLLKTDYPTQADVEAEIRARANAGASKLAGADFTEHQDHWLVRFYYVAPAGTILETGDEADETGDAIEMNTLGGTKGDAVVSAAKQMIDADVRGDHCWHWVDQVYSAAGARPSQVWPSGVYVHMTHPVRNFKLTPHYSDATNNDLMGQLRGGDWLFINNQNTADKNGNHSVIFVGWHSPGVANVAQLPRAHAVSPSIVKVNLSVQPITHLSHAV